MRPSQTVNERLTAVRATQTVAGLVAALEDPSPAVATAAVGRLVQIVGQAAAPELRSMLLEADPAVVDAIAAALLQLKDESAVEIALAALHDEHYTRRLAAVRTLGVFAQPRTASSLCASLRDPVAGVRAAALGALARLGPGDANASECVPLLADPEPFVRLRAIHAITRVARRPGTLIAAAARDPDMEVRLEVAHHLGSLPDDAARSLLSDAAVRVREAAACSAGRAQLDALLALLRDDPSAEVRLAAAHTLGELDEERATDGLVAALEDSDDVVRAAATRALTQLLTPGEVIALLRAELGSPAAARRQAVVYALARVVRLGGPAGVIGRDLAGLTEDPEPRVRLALIHTATDLHADARPMMRYLAGDLNHTVRHAAEMWLVRNSQDSSSAGRARRHA